MGDFTFQVDLKGIIRILSDNLYSSDNVFLRELLQNAIDAIVAKKIASPDFNSEEINILFIEDKDGSTIEFNDNGIGLTEEEIHSFLSVIGKSSKENSNDVRSSYIGQFGIGLLSCFLVADTIEVRTRSSRTNDEKGYLWIGKSDGVYKIEELDEEIPQGTTVRLKISSKMKSKYNKSYIKQYLAEYGFLVQYPIYFTCGNGNDNDKVKEKVNDSYIPWREPFYTKGQAMEFGELVFDRHFFDVIPIMGDGISGFAYISTDGGNGRNMPSQKIYLKDMLITEDGKDLIPSWAFFIQCIINCENLTPTASRESFYRDAKLMKAKSAIERSLIEYFSELSQTEPQRLRSFSMMQNVAIKTLASDNEKVLDIFFPFLNFISNKGNISGKQMLSASTAQRIYYCNDVDEYRKMLPILQSSNALFINAGYIYDSKLIKTAVRRYKLKNIQSLSNDDIGNVLEQASLESEDELSDFVQFSNESLKSMGCIMELRSFFPKELTALFVQNMGGEIVSSLNDDDDDDLAFIMDGFSQGVSDFDYSRLYLNCNSSIAKRLHKVTDSEMAATFAEVIYLQAKMMGSYTLSSNEMEILNKNLGKLIEYGLA